MLQEEELQKRAATINDLRTQLQATMRAATDTKQQLDVANRQLV